MSLSCACDEYDGDGWYYIGPSDYATMPVLDRRKKCCSCRRPIGGGDTVAWFDRYRAPLTEIEERICGNDVELAPMVMCECCADLYFSLVGLGYCINLGDNMRELARDYADLKAAEAANAASRRRLAEDKLLFGCLDSGLLR